MPQEMKDLGRARTKTSEARLSMCINNIKFGAEEWLSQGDLKWKNEAGRKKVKKRQLKDIDKEIYHYWL